MPLTYEQVTYDARIFPALRRLVFAERAKPTWRDEFTAGWGWTEGAGLAFGQTHNAGYRTMAKGTGNTAVGVALAQFSMWKACTAKMQYSSLRLRYHVSSRGTAGRAMVWLNQAGGEYLQYDNLPMTTGRTHEVELCLSQATQQSAGFNAANALTSISLQINASATDPGVGSVVFWDLIEIVPSVSPVGGVMLSQDDGFLDHQMLSALIYAVRAQVKTSIALQVPGSAVAMWQYPGAFALYRGFGGKYFGPLNHGYHVLGSSLTAKHDNERVNIDAYRDAGFTGLEARVHVIGGGTTGPDAAITYGNDYNNAGRNIFDEYALLTRGTWPWWSGAPDDLATGIPMASFMPWRPAQDWWYYSNDVTNANVATFINTYLPQAVASRDVLVMHSHNATLSEANWELLVDAIAALVNNGSLVAVHPWEIWMPPKPAERLSFRSFGVSADLTLLPTAGNATSLGRVSGTHGANTPKLAGSNASGASISETARVQKRLPAHYRSGDVVVLLVHARVTAAVQVAATLDAQVYEGDGEAGVGADICGTAPADLNATAPAWVDCRFVVTPGAMARAGDLLDIELTAAVNDTGGAHASTAEVGRVELLSLPR